MAKTAQVVTYRKIRLFGLLSTDLLAVRYDNDTFIVLGTDGKLFKESNSVVTENIVDTSTVSSTTFKLIKGKRMLEKSIFAEKIWTKKEFLATYLNIVRELQ